LKVQVLLSSQSFPLLVGGAKKGSKRDGMRKSLGVTLLVTSMGFPACAQTSGACKTAMEHANIPKIATAVTDYDVAPLELLFSDQGIEVYSATSFRRPHPLQWIRENGATAIIFYQGENARQKVIGPLRKRGSLPSRVGYPQHLENIKYAMVNFFGPSASFVRDVEYFEPKQCVSPSEEKEAGLLWMDDSDFQVWNMPGLHASKNGPNWITGFYSPYLIADAKGNPLYVKIHNMMADKVKEYMAQHPDRPD
jgi:hypothetical protein